QVRPFQISGGPGGVCARLRPVYSFKDPVYAGDTIEARIEAHDAIYLMPLRRFCGPACLPETPGISGGGPFAPAVSCAGRISMRPPHRSMNVIWLRSRVRTLCEDGHAGAE